MGGSKQGRHPGRGGTEARITGWMTSMKQMLSRQYLWWQKLHKLFEWKNERQVANTNNSRREQWSLNVTLARQLRTDKESWSPAQLWGPCSCLLMGRKWDSEGKWFPPVLGTATGARQKQWKTDIVGDGRLGTED